MAMLMDRKKALRNDGVTWDNMFMDDFRGGGNVGMQHKMGNPAMQMNMPHMNMQNSGMNMQNFGMNNMQNTGGMNMPPPVGMHQMNMSMQQPMNNMHNNIPDVGNTRAPTDVWRKVDASWTGKKGQGNQSQAKKNSTSVQQPAETKKKTPPNLVNTARPNLTYIAPNDKPTANNDKSKDNSAAKKPARTTVANGGNISVTLQNSNSKTTSQINKNGQAGKAVPQNKKSPFNVKNSQNNQAKSSHSQAPKAQANKPQHPKNVGMSVANDDWRTKIGKMFTEPQDVWKKVPEKPAVSYQQTQPHRQQFNSQTKPQSSSASYGYKQPAAASYPQGSSQNDSHFRSQTGSLNPYPRSHERVSQPTQAKSPPPRKQLLSDNWMEEVSAMQRSSFSSAAGLRESRDQQADVNQMFSGRGRERSPIRQEIDNYR